MRVFLREDLPFGKGDAWCTLIQCFTLWSTCYNINRGLHPENTDLLVLFQCQSVLESSSTSMLWNISMSLLFEQAIMQHMLFEQMFGCVCHLASACSSLVARSFISFSALLQKWDSMRFFSCPPFCSSRFLQDDGCGFANHEMSPPSTGGPSLNSICRRSSSFFSFRSLSGFLRLPRRLFSLWWRASLRRPFLPEGLSWCRRPAGRWKPSQQGLP